MTCNLNEKGFTLFEILVGMGIFSIIILSVTGILQSAVEGQRKAIGAQNTQESMRYVLEVISKEIRMAKRNDGYCSDGPQTGIFYVENDTLYFRNQYDECVAYYKETDAGGKNRFKITRDEVGGYISTDEISVDYLEFYKKNSDQPAVTITMRVSTEESTKSRSDIDIQTTISSRYYIEDKVITE